MVCDSFLKSKKSAGKVIESGVIELCGGGWGGYRRSWVRRGGGKNIFGWLVCRILLVVGNENIKEGRPCQVCN